MRVAVLGTGLMGYPLVKKLLEADLEVLAYNRTREKALPLADEGARVVDTPAEAVMGAECSILMVTDAQAIDEVLFQNGEIDFMGKTILQMGTIAPEESEELLEKIRAAGGDYFEAPVLGNKHHIRSGDLQVMVGGTDEQFNRWRELMQIFGRLYFVGPVGSALALKLALNQLIASLSASFGLSLKLIRKTGVDLDLFMDVLRDSALYAPQFDKKLEGWLNSEYSDPNFSTEHLLKDVELMLKACNRENLETAALEGVSTIIRNALNKGFEGQDYSSLVEGIEK